MCDYIISNPSILKLKIDTENVSNQGQQSVV